MRSPVPRWAAPGLADRHRPQGAVVGMDSDPFEWSEAAARAALKVHRRPWLRRRRYCADCHQRWECDTAWQARRFLERLDRARRPSDPPEWGPDFRIRR